MKTDRLDRIELARRDLLMRREERLHARRVLDACELKERRAADRLALLIREAKETLSAAQVTVANTDQCRSPASYNRIDGGISPA